MTWTGTIPAQKWSSFYMKILTQLVANTNLQLSVTVTATAPEGLATQTVDQIQGALRELGLPDHVDVEPQSSRES
jgi:hypothetical protein